MNSIASNEVSKASNEVSKASNEAFIESNEAFIESNEAFIEKKNKYETIDVFRKNIEENSKIIEEPISLKSKEKKEKKMIIKSEIWLNKLDSCSNKKEIELKQYSGVNINTSSLQLYKQKQNQIKQTNKLLRTTRTSFNNNRERIKSSFPLSLLLEVNSNHILLLEIKDYKTIKNSVYEFIHNHSFYFQEKEEMAFLICYKIYSYLDDPFSTLTSKCKKIQKKL